MQDERPIDIWNEMTTTARATGRCMFCEAPLVSRGKRPVVCPDEGCNKTYHRLYRHLVRNPRERNEPAEVARVSAEERLAIRRTRYSRLSEAEKERLRERARKWYKGLTPEQRAKRSADHAARQRAKRARTRDGAAPTKEAD